MKILLTMLLSITTFCSNAQNDKKESALENRTIITKKKIDQFHQGENVVISKEQYSLIAKVKDKKITQWIIREKDGKEYLPKSVTTSHVQKKKNGTIKMEPFCIYCFYVQCCGWVCFQTYNNCR